MTELAASGADAVAGPFMFCSSSAAYGRSMIALLTPLMAVLGPLAVFLLMGVLFAETGLLAGFFLPGDSLLFAAGVLVAAGAIQLPIWLVAVAAFAAAVVGDQVGYLVGRRFGPRVFSRADSRWLSRDHVSRAERFFDRHGPKAVLLARFVPVVRTLVPAVAGMGRMPRRRFTAYNVAGGLGWAVGMLLAGFFLGGIAFIAAHIELLAIGVVALSLVPAGIAVIRRRVRRPSLRARPARGGWRSAPRRAADPRTWMLPGGSTATLRR
jgi:membrane-associated protein/undecaprenyl-diphosphatase